MHINAQSCANTQTHDEIKLFLSRCPYTVHVLVISETWFQQPLCPLFEITGYTSIHSCRRTGRGGGLSIYVSNECKIIRQHIYSNAINLISIAIDIGNRKVIDVIGFYRPPNNNNLAEFFEVCESIIENQSSNGCYILGDANINTSEQTHTAIKLKYLNLFKSHGFELCNNKATRSASNTTIDHIFTNLTNKRDHSTNTIKCDFSDHNIVITRGKESVDGPEMHTYKSIDYNKLRTTLDTKLRATHQHSNGVEALYDSLSTAIKESMDTASVTRTICQKRFKHCQWLVETPKLLKFLNKKFNQKTQTTELERIKYHRNQ